VLPEATVASVPEISLDYSLPTAMYPFCRGCSHVAMIGLSTPALCPNCLCCTSARWTVSMCLQQRQPTRKHEYAAGHMRCVIHDHSIVTDTHVVQPSWNSSVCTAASADAAPLAAPLQLRDGGSVNALRRCRCSGRFGVPPGATVAKNIVSERNERGTSQNATTCPLDADHDFHTTTTMDVF
jgi:hypothetical protein